MIFFVDLLLVYFDFVTDFNVNFDKALHSLVFSFLVQDIELDVGVKLDLLVKFHNLDF